MIIFVVFLYIYIYIFKGIGDLNVEFKIFLIYLNARTTKFSVSAIFLLVMRIKRFKWILSNELWKKK